jgi:hypothetical protein
MVYNEDRKFECMLDPKALDVADVRAVIQEKGIQGSKGYFWAYMEKGKNEIIIITDPILPAESW